MLPSLTLQRLILTFKPSYICLRSPCQIHVLSLLLILSPLPTIFLCLFTQLKCQPDIYLRQEEVIQEASILKALSLTWLLERSKPVSGVNGMVTIYYQHD